MVSQALQEELMEQVSHLPIELQKRVLEFARALRMSEPKGTPGKELAPFFGILTEEEADAMLKAIEENCEQVNPDEW